ncbi:uncharacterized protein LOC107866899 isoform X2 [Capsicum annuum]|uniref:uncharacterized protein LOC107866899 isoform X2 n=1 Tax=Capsicum annuum TaxID=4072 RepID=UPI001FB14BC3|nr:uncharacterized protein LOC107866899 isoform X2 [Capsicum annuum]XP_047267324.1 uncharacterized protein LOC107866899 isoform X2 [Capsicum annuum]XP_047267325.1 uncharacterized protein LOC107866899 isoform X2 [Capsicum annuum]XP_047267326.1 uncharacterized protein LOC107866899 isoform X2 [Capsicum annuum]XP_047267327.1 uncharacterized protein LOC107866899 isoform X2 [Capsicum annuum]XP_047267328.1 uncharacterized protein LOC107866899 isoform X2 [Capsicum annuum]
MIEEKGAKFSMDNSEMGCLRSDGIEEIHPDVSVRKRFKFPKKFFDECNGVDHASVPRKVRSASKKRIRRLISPPLSISKRANHMSDGAETLRKYVSKSKLNLNRCGSSRCMEEELEGPITKDEEEVAETLYALAGMIPDTDTLSESKINSQLPEVKSLDLPEPETSVIASGVVTAEQDMKTTGSQFSAEALDQFPDVAASAGEAAKSKSFDNASQCDTSTNTEQLKISQQPVVAYQANQQNIHKEKRNNGIAGSSLWPGLSAVGSSCSGILDSSQFPIAKCPVWFRSTGSELQAQNAESCLPTLKDSHVPLDLRKSFKRCAAHVYISRLTKVLQSGVRSGTISSHTSQSSSPDGVKQEIRIIQNSPTGKVNDDMHGIVSTGSTASTAEKNPTELRNAILLHKRLLQDQQQASTTSGFSSLAKQNVDFLSLSAGSYVIKGTNGANITGHNLEAPISSHKHPALQFWPPQNGYSSAPFRYHPATATAQQVLLPPYLGGASICPSREATMALPKQMSQQNELQKPHFAGQYKFGVTASQMGDWLNAGRQMPIFGLSQAQFAAPSSSAEALSSKYAPPLLNEQELMSTSASRATSRMRGQYYSFPSGMEGNGHGLYPNNVPSLQLLCNDRR